MKIICKDNFDREHVSDKLIAENVDAVYAYRIAKLLNESEGESSSHFYLAVSDDYVLYTFNP
jgi:hypothetical protein